MGDFVRSLTYVSRFVIKRQDVIGSLHLSGVQKERFNLRIFPIALAQVIPRKVKLLTDAKVQIVPKVPLVLHATIFLLEAKNYLSGTKIRTHARCHASKSLCT
jgi:hypothetical protein